PLLGSDGGAVVAHFDVSDRKRAERDAQSRHQVLRAVLDGSAGGVVIADADGTFRLFNQGAREIAGVGLIESSPDRWSDDFGLFHEDRVTLFRPEDLPLALALRGESCDGVRIFLKNPAVPEGKLIE